MTVLASVARRNHLYLNALSLHPQKRNEGPALPAVAPVDFATFCRHGASSLIANMILNACVSSWSYQRHQGRDGLTIRCMCLVRGALGIAQEQGGNVHNKATAVYERTMLYIICVPEMRIHHTCRFSSEGDWRNSRHGAAFPRKRRRTCLRRSPHRSWHTVAVRVPSVRIGQKTSNMSTFITSLALV